MPIDRVHWSAHMKNIVIYEVKVTIYLQHIQQFSVDYVFAYVLEYRNIIPAMISLSSI